MPWSGPAPRVDRLRQLDQGSAGLVDRLLAGRPDRPSGHATSRRHDVLHPAVLGRPGGRRTGGLLPPIHRDRRAGRPPPRRRGAARAPRRPHGRRGLRRPGRPAVEHQLPRRRRARGLGDGRLWPRGTRARPRPPRRARLRFRPALHRRRWPGLVSALVAARVARRRGTPAGPGPLPTARLAGRDPTAVRPRDRSRTWSPATAGTSAASPTRSTRSRRWPGCTPRATTRPRWPPPTAAPTASASCRARPGSGGGTTTPATAAWSRATRSTACTSTRWRRWRCSTWPRPAAQVDRTRSAAGLAGWSSAPEAAESWSWTVRPHCRKVGPQRPAQARARRRGRSPRAAARDASCRRSTGSGRRPRSTASAGRTSSAGSWTAGWAARRAARPVRVVRACHQRLSYVRRLVASAPEVPRPGRRCGRLCSVSR